MAGIVHRSKLPYVSCAKVGRSTSSQRRIERCVNHITGRGTWLNAERTRQDPLDRLEDILFNKVGTWSYSTYSVCPWGEVRCHGDERMIPFAQGYRDSVRKVLKRSVPRWWIEAWTDFDANVGLVENKYMELQTRDHPVDLLPDGRSSRRGPNWYSVSIEFVQYGNQLLLTEAQVRNGSELIMDICTRNNIEHNRIGCLGHEDYNPWARGYDKTGGWDPGETNIPQADWDWETMLTLPLLESHNQDAEILTMIDNGLAIATPPMPEFIRMHKERRKSPILSLVEGQWTYNV